MTVSSYILIQTEVGKASDVVAAVRNLPGVVQADDVTGPYSGPYTAGGVWAVLDGTGTVTVNGATVVVDHAGAYELIAHERSTAGELALEVGAGVVCHAVCFTPGLTG